MSRCYIACTRDAPGCSLDFNLNRGLINLKSIFPELKFRISVVPELRETKILIAEIYNHCVLILIYLIYPIYFKYSIVH